MLITPVAEEMTFPITFAEIPVTERTGRIFSFTDISRVIHPPRVKALLSSDRCRSSRKAIRFDTPPPHAIGHIHGLFNVFWKYPLIETYETSSEKFEVFSSDGCNLFRILNRANSPRM
jgi:hypothetical protein